MNNNIGYDCVVLRNFDLSILRRLRTMALITALQKGIFINPEFMMNSRESGPYPPHPKPRLILLESSPPALLDLPPPPPHLMPMAPLNPHPSKNHILLGLVALLLTALVHPSTASSVPTHCRGFYGTRIALSQDRIGDDYCDCADGLDELHHSSACSSR